MDTSYFVQSPATKLLRTEDEINAADPRFDYVLVNPNSQHVTAIGSLEASLWRLLKRPQSYLQLVTVMTEHTGQFQQKLVEQCLESWLQAGFIDYVGQSAALSSPKHSWYRRLLVRELDWYGFDRLLTKLYDIVGRYFTTRYGIFILVAIIATGFALGIWAVANGKVATLQDLRLLDILILFGGSIVTVALHELGHAIAMKWAGLKVYRAGFMLYLGLPMFFVDTSPIWAKSRRKRMVTALAGIFVNLLLAAVAVIGSYLVADVWLQQLMWEGVLVNLLTVAVSLVPFVKMDGYYLLEDVIGTPNLSTKAIKQLRSLFYHGISVEVESSHPKLLAAYAVASALVSLGFAAYAALYWFRLVTLLFS